MDLSIITTYRCDSKCQMCYIWQNPTHPKEEISSETLAKLPNGFDNVNLSGGEPTLRTDLIDLVDTVWPKGRIIEISSNGLHADRLIPIVKKYPTIKIRFSLEGKETLNNQIRGEKNGFQLKVEGLKRLKEVGGKDLGFATVIQDENAEQLVYLYELAKKMGVELSTSTLHNAWQFHKNDNYFYNRLPVAKEVEKLITSMLKTYSIKNWFRAFLNLGLIKKILGQDRLIKCTAGTDFIFLDPWSDVWACNVRTDLPMGNLVKQSWDEILSSDVAKKSVDKVAICKQNCWMVTTARTAMRSNLIPGFPKAQPFWWVVLNKIKVSFGLPILFEKYIDYGTVATNPHVERKSFLDKSVKRNLQMAEDEHYVLKEFQNR